MGGQRPAQRVRLSAEGRVPCTPEARRMDGGASRAVRTERGAHLPQPVPALSCLPVSLAKERAGLALPGGKRWQPERVAGEGDSGDIRPGCAGEDGTIDRGVW